MKIIELRAENIKNLKAIEIHPNGDAVILAGRNGAGKSAVLDAILMALTGKKIEEPIRHGEKRAEININMGDFTVRKIFTEKGDRLEINSNAKGEDGKKGAAFLSPQDMLNKIFGTMSFDPLAFATMKPKMQKDLLADLLGLNFDALDKKRQELYDERTRKNREIKGQDPGKYRPDPSAPLPLEALVSNMLVPEPGTPRVEISVADEMAKVQDLEARKTVHNKFLEVQKGVVEDIDSCKESISNAKEEIEKAKQVLAEKEKILASLEVALCDYEKDFAEMTEPVEVTDDQMANARKAFIDVDAKNKSIRAAIEYDAKLAQLDAAKKEVAHLEDAMMKIDLEKQDKIKNAKFPIEGLALDGEMVTYQGKPLSQLSTGEQIRVSTAIAMALNPDLKLILVREGSLLDDDGMKAIMDIAKDKDYQLFIERVSSDKSVGVYIEDGQIVSVDGKEA